MKYTQINIKRKPADQLKRAANLWKAMRREQRRIGLQQ